MGRHRGRKEGRAAVRPPRPLAALGVAAAGGLALSLLVPGLVHHRGPASAPDSVVAETLAASTTASSAPPTSDGPTPTESTAPPSEPTTDPTTSTTDPAPTDPTTASEAGTPTESGVSAPSDPAPGETAVVPAPLAAAPTAATTPAAAGPAAALTPGPTATPAELDVTSRWPSGWLLAVRVLGEKRHRSRSHTTTARGAGTATPVRVAVPARSRGTGAVTGQPAPAVATTPSSANGATAGPADSSLPAPRKQVQTDPVDYSWHFTIERAPVLFICGVLALGVFLAASAAAMQGTGAHRRR